MNYFLIFVTTFLVVSLTVPIGQRLSRRFEILARPGGRRQHKGLIPKLGGLPLILGLLVAWGIIGWRFTFHVKMQPSGG